MNSRRQVPAFGISFLDLLSGALGAVILLYVIVPKLTVTVEEFEAQRELAAEVERLNLSIEALEGVIPAEELAALQERLERLDEARARVEAALEAREREVAALTAEVEELRSALEAAEARAQAAEERAEQAESRADELEGELARSQEELQSCQAELDQCEGDEIIRGDQRFIMANLDWSTEFHDVDLHVVDPAGNEFYYAARTFPGVTGELTLDNTCGPGFEVWQVIDPSPGTYRIYANLFARMGNSCTAGGTPARNSPVRLRVFHRNGIQTVEATLTQEGSGQKVLLMTAEVDGAGNVQLSPAR